MGILVVQFFPFVSYFHNNNMFNVCYLHRLDQILSSDVIDFKIIVDLSNLSALALPIHFPSTSHFPLSCLLPILTYIFHKIDLSNLSYYLAGGRWNFSGAHPVTSEGPMFVDRMRHGDRGHTDDAFFRRQQFPIEGINRPSMDRHIDDRFSYDNTGHGLKRPFSMTVSHMSFSVAPFPVTISG